MISNIVKKILKEVTNTKSNGEYFSALSPSYREFDKHISGPFTEYATQWDDPLLDYDSLDGKMSTDSKTIRRKEKRAEKISKFMKNNPMRFDLKQVSILLNRLSDYLFIFARYAEQS